MAHVCFTRPDAICLLFRTLRVAVTLKVVVEPVMWRNTQNRGFGRCRYRSENDVDEHRSCNHDRFAGCNIFVAVRSYIDNLLGQMSSQTQWVL